MGDHTVGKARKEEKLRGTCTLEMCMLYMCIMFTIQSCLPSIFEVLENEKSLNIPNFTKELTT